LPGGIFRALDDALPYLARFSPSAGSRQTPFLDYDSLTRPRSFPFFLGPPCPIAPALVLFPGMSSFILNSVGSRLSYVNVGFFFPSGGYSSFFVSLQSLASQVFQGKILVHLLLVTLGSVELDSLFIISKLVFQRKRVFLPFSFPLCVLFSPSVLTTGREQTVGLSSPRLPLSLFYFFLSFSLFSFFSSISYLARFLTVDNLPLSAGSPFLFFPQKPTFFPTPF